MEADRIEHPRPEREHHDQREAQAEQWIGAPAQRERSNAYGAHGRGPQHGRLRPHDENESGESQPREGEPRPQPEPARRERDRAEDDRHVAARDGHPVGLSRKEFAVLAELLRAEGGVVSAEQLLEKAWDEHADPFTGVVRFTIMMVRRKLGEPPVIETVPGTTYTFVTDGIEAGLAQARPAAGERNVGIWGGANVCASTSRQAYWMRCRFTSF